jgi:hypothetical protein
MQGAIGELNPRWNGGTSEYKNHYTMKKNRILKMNTVKWKCEKCGNDAIYVHHIDKTKTNHKICNLMAVCRLCHAQLHKRKKHKTINMDKYYKEYYLKNRKKIIDYAKQYYKTHTTKTIKKLFKNTY